jgi:sodium/hydrogen exchanger 8
VLKKFQKDIYDPNENKYNRTEIAIMVASPVITYLLSQGIGLSGIVSILFSGLVLSQYAAEMLSIKTRKVLKLLYQTTAYICEGTVFIFLGMSLVEYFPAYKEAGAVLLIGNIVIVLCARYFNIGICSLIVNNGRVRKPIGGIFQLVMWYSGLRGTIAYILALQCSLEFKEGNGKVIVLITIIFALFTVLCLN